MKDIHIFVLQNIRNVCCHQSYHPHKLGVQYGMRQLTCSIDFFQLVQRSMYHVYFITRRVTQCLMLLQTLYYQKSLYIYMLDMYVLLINDSGQCNVMCDDNQTVNLIFQKRKELSDILYVQSFQNTYLGDCLLFIG